MTGDGDFLTGFERAAFASSLMDDGLWSEQQWVQKMPKT